MKDYRTKESQKIVHRKHSIGSDEQEICPFTLEPFEDCQTVEFTYDKNICPFILEPCVQQVVLSQ
jgi:hypothetical protein